MITVQQTSTGNGLFAKVIGVDSVQIHTHASAIAELPSSLLGVAPITVKITHPQLSGPGCPCFGVPTTIDLGDQGAPGAFSLIDLDSSSNGTDGASTIAQWIETGYDRQLPLGGYYSRPGAAFNNSQIQGALKDHYGTELLFPIYDTLTGTGANAQYHIVAWAAYHVTHTDAHGNGGDDRQAGSRASSGRGSSARAALPRTSPTSACARWRSSSDRLVTRPNGGVASAAPASNSRR